MRPDLPDEAPETRVDSDDLGEGEEEYADASGVAHPPPRRDASMTLLTSMLERPLDPGYAAAAEQRRAAGLPALVGHHRRHHTARSLSTRPGQHLGVMSRQVVVDSADGWGSDRGVDPVVIVEVDPPW